MADSRRLFFALWPNKSIRQQLDVVARQYRPHQARAIPLTNLHATLIFLGAMPEPMLPDIRQAAATVPLQSFEMSLQLLEVWRRPQVLCLCPQTIPLPLQQMHDALAGALRAAQVPFDERAYRPHVTLARKVRRTIDTAALAEPVVWPVSGFALVESVSVARGVRYEPLQQWYAAT